MQTHLHRSVAHTPPRSTLCRIAQRCQRAVRLLRPLAWLLCLLLASLALPVRAEVRLPDGQWFEQTLDLRVKVMGGAVTMSRTWLNNRWYFNPSWAPLTFRYDALGRITTIERAGWSYQEHGSGVWAFDNKNSIVATGSGYRWQDRLGNSIEYDNLGRILSYADRNAVKVSFGRDAVGRTTGVFDHFGRQVLWFEYAMAADLVLSLQLVNSADVGLPSAIRDSSGRRVEYRYSNARLSSVVDVLGYEWHYGYDGAGRLASRTDPENRTLSVAYGANGRVSAVTETDSTVTAYGYDFDSVQREVVVQIRHPTGRQEQMWYGLDGVPVRHEIAGQLRSQILTDGRRLVVTEANGAQTVEDFDEWGNLVKRLYADGSTEIFEREPRFSQLSRYVDGNGNETRYEYDARGNLIHRVDAVGTAQTRTTEYAYDTYGNRTLARRLGDAVTAESTFTYSYDQSGNLVTVTDPEGNISRYGYDPQGNLLSFAEGLGDTWRYDYDAAGRLVSETDPLGSVARYAYDKVGNAVGYTDRRGQTWRFEYDTRDRVVGRVDPLGNTARTEYDADGFPIRELDEDGHSVEMTYDPIKRLSAMRDGRGNVVELRYPQTPGAGTSSFGPGRIVYPTFDQELRFDTRNRVTAISDILGGDVRLTRYQYDKAGNRTATTNALGDTASYVYDALDRLVRMVDRLGHVTELAYDNHDNVLGVTDANAHVWRFEYDRSNRRVKESKPQGEATLVRYDAADQLVELTDAKGQHLLYDYDVNGRLTRERHYSTDPSGSPPIKQVTYAYDAEDNLTAWADGEHSAQIVYDELSRLSSETVDYGPFSLTYAYTYHANGLTKTLTYPGGAIYSYGYDARNELSVVDIPGEGSITVNTFRWTAPTEITLPGGTVQRHTFDGLLQPIEQEVVSPGAVDLLSMSSTYGTVQQLIERSIDGAITRYSYDSETRVLEASSSNGQQETYTLDAVGNRLSASASPGPWEYDENNRLMRAGDTTYAYDGNGNVTSRTQGAQVTRFFYDTTDRLVRVEDGAGNIVARYGYDPYGRRLWKRADSSVRYFLYAQEGLIGEYDALGQETAAYGWRPDSIWGTDPLFYKVGSRYFYAHTDHLGTPLKLSDKAGNVAWSARYSTFGQASVAPASTVIYNLRLPGQYFDAETGLHYNWLRYYEPRTGRYLQYDPLGLDGSINGYAYTDADPLNRIDPRGDIAPLALAAGAALAYLKCVGQCALENAAIGLIMGECLDWNGTVKPCFAECLSPLNWIKIPGFKVVNKLRKAKAKRPIVIGENMKGRVIPYAKKNNADYYKPRSKDPERWMENNMRWLREKMKEGREIIDRGIDPLRHERSPHYEAEKELIRKHNYPTVEP